MIGHEKRKIRTALKNILIQINKAISSMEGIDPEDPFANAGASNANNLRAHIAYQDLLISIDSEEINRMIGEINSRAWQDEEYAKVARVLVGAAKKLATTI